MAFGALDHLRGAGLRVPDDVSVIGFDDVPMAGWASYRLTTLRQDPARIAREVVAILDRRNAEPDLPPLSVMLPGRACRSRNRQGRGPAAMAPEATRQSPSSRRPDAAGDERNPIHALQLPCPRGRAGPRLRPPRLQPALPGEHAARRLQAAKDWGATTVEIDVVLTADGEPVVLHDLTLDRTTDGHGFAADLDLERIRAPRRRGALRPALRRDPRPDAGGGARLGEARGHGPGARDQGGRAPRPRRRPRRGAARGDGHRRPGHRDQLRPRRAEARRRAPPGPAHRGHHPRPPRRHRRGAAGLRRQLGLDRARHVPPGRREGAARRRALQPRAPAAARRRWPKLWRGGRDIVPRVVDWIAEGLIDTDLRRRRAVPRPARRARRAGRRGR